MAKNKTEIDRHLANALRKITRLTREVRAKKVPVHAGVRTRTPGPNSYRHMSAGELATAALAGSVAYHWTQQEQQTFLNELESRGFTESHHAWTEGQEDPTPDNPVVITKTTLDRLASEIDQGITGDDGSVREPLTPSEVIDDMYATNAEPAAISAYEQGVDIHISDSELSSTEQTSYEDPGMVMQPTIVEEVTL